MVDTELESKKIEHSEKTYHLTYIRKETNKQKGRIRLE